LREKMEEDGLIDTYEKLQDMTRAKVDETMIDVRIEQLYEYVDGGGVVMKQLCSLVVVAVKTQNRVLVRWNKEQIQDGLDITQQKLMVSKWNKHVRERMAEICIILVINPLVDHEMNQICVLLYC